MAQLGVYICSYDEMRKQSKMDMVGVMVRLKYALVLNKIFNVQIKKGIFIIKMIEDSQRPLTIILPRKGEEDEGVVN